MTRTLGAAISALALGGALALASMSGASAQSVMKQCGDEWQAAKAAGTTNGQTWNQFLKDCRARHEAMATPTPAPSATPTPAPTPVATATATPTPKPTKAIAKASPSGEGEFANEADAKAKCPTDTVVWVNLHSKKYHYSGHPDYGHTKRGAYMCEADANAAGYVPAKNEKPN